MEWEWYDDIPTKVLFLHMLFRANHKAKKWHGVEVKRGQFISGRKKLSQETGLSERQIRTAITKLKSTNELTTKTTSTYTLYTIENYSKYQNKESEATTKTTSNVTNERPTSDQRATTNKNVKKEKNINIPPSIEQVSTYCKERNNGVDPQTFIDHYEANGWMRGKNKIKDWKACVRTWEKNHFNQPNNPNNFNEGVFV